MGGIGLACGRRAVSAAVVVCSFFRPLMIARAWVSQDKLVMVRGSSRRRTVQWLDMTGTPSRPGEDEEAGRYGPQPGSRVTNPPQFEEETEVRQCPRSMPSGHRHSWNVKRVSRRRVRQQWASVR